MARYASCSLASFTSEMALPSSKVVTSKFSQSMISPPRSFGRAAVTRRIALMQPKLHRDHWRTQTADDPLLPYGHREVDLRISRSADFRESSALHGLGDRGRLHRLVVDRRHMPERDRQHAHSRRRRNLVREAKR